MSKAWHSTKENKKQPAMTPKEKKALKHAKKHPQGMLVVPQTHH